MTAAFIVVVALALVPQIAFSFLYWRWIPSWVKNAYGRLAQLGAWCHIIFLSVFESFLIFGKYINPLFGQYVLIFSFFPLIAFGILQLDLLKKAAGSAKTEEEIGEEKQDDS